jgi:hypothetical protein
MTSRLPRLRPSELTKERISRSMKGHAVSEETRAKIAEGLKGRKHTPEAIEKMRAARARRPKKTNEVVLEQCQQVAKARWQENYEIRYHQWRADLRAAREMGNMKLWRDVKRSEGWRFRRLFFDTSGRVSDGAYKPKRGKTCRLEIAWNKAKDNPWTLPSQLLA